MAEFVPLNEDSGIQKKILSEGQGDLPKSGNSCKMFYTGKLEDGTEFDSNAGTGKPFKFTLGTGQVIKGWDVGVATMRQGEKAQLKITAPYGYGDAGSPPKIPGGATLIFDVELVGFKEGKKKKWEMTEGEKLQEANVYKAKGNEAYKAKSYQEAATLYKKAVEFLDFEDEVIKELKATTNLNLALAYF